MDRSVRLCVLCGIFLAVGLPIQSHGDDTLDELDVIEADHVHPLTGALAYARSRAAHIRENIRDYQGRLIKRERIDGRLQSYQFIDVQMRCAQQSDGETIPMAVFLQYLSPKSMKDRRVLYVAGQNSGRMLVRKGGSSLQHVVLRIDPFGSGARRESNYPITDIGFEKMIQRLIERLVEDMAADPKGSNTKVTMFRGAKVGKRVCTRIEVVHPEYDKRVQFHQANLYVDDELQLPIRLTVHDWSEKAGAAPRLIEEYTYVNLKVNVGFGDAEFAKTRLESKSDSPQMTAANR